MVTIDLSTPPAPASSLLDGLPRRLSLTLPELRHLATLAGGAPLPFDVVPPSDPPSSHAAPEGLASRLGQTRATAEDEAYQAALASLHDPAQTLLHRGLVDEGGAAESSLLGAVGLLATPRLALDIDVAAGGTQVKAWHRSADGAVATLSTCDGIVFELAWFPTDQWADELTRTTVIPKDLAGGESAVPADLEAPYPLLDGIGEALHNGRIDLVPVLVTQAMESAAVGEATVTSAGRSLSSAESVTALQAFHSESAGRLRVLAAEIAPTADGADPAAVGLVSWVLLADGWHSITPRRNGDEARVAVCRVDPDALASELAPVLAKVTRQLNGGAA